MEKIENFNKHLNAEERAMIMLMQQKAAAGGSQTSSSDVWEGIKPQVQKIQRDAV